jgi:bromodomain-containing protein 3
VLSKLAYRRQHKWAWVFNEPVNAEELGCTDYYTIIKNPMDLGTVKKKLEEGQYTSPEQFAEDVRLIWANAKLYNPPGNDVHHMATSLEEVFEKKVSELLANYDPSASADEMPVSRTDSKKPQLPPVTFKEKRELGLTISKLPVKKLARVLHIIHQRDPTVLKQNPSDSQAEVEIDIDALEDSTLRYLDKFARACLDRRSIKKESLAGSRGTKQRTPTFPM